MPGLVVIWPLRLRGSGLQYGSCPYPILDLIGAARNDVLEGGIANILRLLGLQGK